MIKHRESRADRARRISVAAAKAREAAQEFQRLISNDLMKLDGTRSTIGDTFYDFIGMCDRAHKVYLHVANNPQRKDLS